MVRNGLRTLEKEGAAFETKVDGDAATVAFTVPHLSPPHLGVSHAREGGR